MKLLLEMPERVFLMMKVSVAQLILRKRMTRKVKVVNAGKCMLCGKKIRITNRKIPNLFFCSKCENKVKEGKNDSKHLRNTTPSI